MTTQRRRKAISIEVKNDIIRRLENGESNSSIAKDFGVSHTTISMIFKNKDKIKACFKSNVLKVKRLRNSIHEDVDLALVDWFRVMRHGGLRITNSMLKEKANCFALHFNKPNFKCSDSWINRFKTRNNIDLGSIGDESVRIAKEYWLQSVWPPIRSKFSDDQIFNADETGLFYKSVPHTTLELYGERCSRGELSEERFTVMVAANLSGTIKKDLLIIGKTPRSFAIESLPAYEENCNAWMTAEIFEKWIRDWDRELVKINKSILLLVDSCSDHPNVTGLKSITLAFLPPSTASALQPMNQGIIQALKYNFRKNLTLKFNESLAIKPESPLAEITVVDAMLMLHDAWDKISQKTIYNSYKRAGYVDNHIANDVFTDEPSVHDEPFSLWVNNLAIFPLVSLKNWEKYVVVDSALITSEELTDEIIVQNVIKDLRENEKQQQETEIFNSSLTPVCRSEGNTSEIISDNLADIKHKIDIKEEQADEELLAPFDSESEPPDDPLKQNLDKDSHVNNIKIEIKKESKPNAAEALQAAELLSQFVEDNIEDDNIKKAMSSVHSFLRDYLL